MVGGCHDDADQQLVVELDDLRGADAVLPPDDEEGVVPLLRRRPVLRQDRKEKREEENFELRRSAKVMRR